MSCERVIGTWGSGTLNQVPPGSVLYAHSHRAAWKEIRAARGRARFWKKRYVAYEIEGFRVNSLRDALSNLDPDSAFDSLANWAEWVEGNGANLSSLTSTSWSIWKRSLSRRMLLASNALPMPKDDLIIGGRQEAKAGVYDEAELWDINGAYQSAMRSMLVGARYRHVTGRPIRMENSTWKDCVGFARAHVYLTRNKGSFGPLPCADNGRVGFPSKGSVDGIYDLEELRVARECGATVLVFEAWIGRGLRLPWRKWSDIISTGRDLPGIAGKLVKTMSNSLWGGFSVSGRGAWVDYFTGTVRVIYDERETIAPCRALSAHISAHVRSRLYRDALHFWSAGPFCISAHTDGAIFQTPAYPSGDLGSGLGEWRRKARMKNLVLVNAQAYRYSDVDSGETRYVVAGAPPEFAPRVFSAILRKHADREASERPRNLLDFGAWLT